MPHRNRSDWKDPRIPEDEDEDEDFSVVFWVCVALFALGALTWVMQ